MKLMRWAVAGATAYAIYKYSIGKKAKGEDVFVSSDRALEEGGSPTQPAVRQKDKATKGPRGAKTR